MGTSDHGSTREVFPRDGERVPGTPLMQQSLEGKCNCHWTYDKKMKPCPDDDDNSEGDSSDSDCNISDDDTGDGAGGPPRKKARTSTISSTISRVKDNRSSLRDPLYVTRHYLISPYC
jgi:hypothetical protein